MNEIDLLKSVRIKCKTMTCVRVSASDIRYLYFLLAIAFIGCNLTILSILRRPRDLRINACLIVKWKEQRSVKWVYSFSFLTMQFFAWEPCWLSWSIWGLMLIYVLLHTFSVNRFFYLRRKICYFSSIQIHSYFCIIFHSHTNLNLWVLIL